MKRFLLFLGIINIFSLNIFSKPKNIEKEQEKTAEFILNDLIKSFSVEDRKKIQGNEGKLLKLREQIIDFAKTKLNVPYVWGANGPDAFDCSGFVSYVFNKVANLKLPRVSSLQATFKPKIASSSMEKGDLVFFETTGHGISHVGIYIGNRQFIHASSGKNNRVMISSLDSNYYSNSYRWSINPFQ